jgi:calcium binding protein 39
VQAKKDLAIVLGILMRRQVGQRFVTVEYLARNPNLLEHLTLGYDNPDIALNCGAILRECARHEPLTRLILYSEHFFKFFGYVELPNFDIASDSFSTLKELLTAHKSLVAEFLEKHYDQVFEHYAKLLHSENYVTKRQSLKLLGELLLDRANFAVMTRYISHAANLKLMMTLLRDKMRSIQYEAFHVFKVFVANPNKPKPILDILIQNKDKLIKFLSKFHNDRGAFPLLPESHASPLKPSVPLFR